MSVINQMLKDLEQRAAEPNTHANQANIVVVAHSPRKIVLVTAVCVLAICLLSFYVWQLISENKALKAEQIITSANAAQMNPVKSIISMSNQASSNDEKVAEIVKVPVKKAPSINRADNTTKLSKTQVDNNQAASTQMVSAQIVKAKPVVNNNVSQVTPAKKDGVIADTHSHTAGTTSGHSHNVVTAVKPKIKVKANKMSVSRRQLSADELAQKKLTLAEKALASKEIAKAEKLLEDVIIIKPSDSQTRKKLAALWFGRQAYQDAVNLLSQGIALNNKDSSLREMKARIHLKQGQVTAALNTLKPLAQLKDEDYQIMLANTAQQAQQNNVAVDAYKMLITMQPTKGRWQLGLAVLYDKNSQFDLASVAYKQALTKNDLSISSEEFVKERIQVIGQ